MKWWVVEGINIKEGEKMERIKLIKLLDSLEMQNIKYFKIVYEDESCVTKHIEGGENN